MTPDVLFLHMKGELVQKGIYKSSSQGKFFIKERKERKKFVKLVVHVGSFDPLVPIIDFMMWLEGSKKSQR